MNERMMYLYTDIPIFEGLRMDSHHGSRHSKQSDLIHKIHGNWPSRVWFSPSTRSWNMTFRWEELFFVEWQAICVHLSVWTMMDHGFMVINRVRLNVVAWKLSGPRKLTNVPFSKGPFQKGKDRLPTIIFWGPLVTIWRIPLLKHDPGKK